MASAAGEKPVSGEKKPSTPGKESETAPIDPVTAQYQLLITEIESSDGHLGTTLRTIYEDADPRPFMNQLDDRIKGHDKEIERMCNYHYQGFIDSVRGLLQVRQDVEKLKDEIQDIDAQLQHSGQKLMGRAEQMIKYRKIQHNIEAAMETLSNCLPVLETYGKLREQMKTKRYYPALKTLEQLEHAYLPRVSNYRFAQAMCATTPRLRQAIMDASMADLKDFLENIRKHSQRIGEVAMRHAAEQNNMDSSLALRKTKKRKAPKPPNPFTGEVEEDDDGEDDSDLMMPDDDVEEGLSAQDLIDFSPVHRCLHIYSVLAAKETFESYYRKQRRKQARLALQPPSAMDRSRRLTESRGLDPFPHETLEGYKTYFHDIVGFFVVEDHILHTTSGLVNQTYIDELWDMALAKIVATLRTHIGFCTDPTLMLQIKNLVMLLSHTLRSYGFTVSQLSDLLLEIKDQYSEILMKRWVAIFNNIFDEDNYTPIMAETPEVYTTVTDMFPFEDVTLSLEPFPKCLPFSHFVPNVYSQVKEYIYACLKFSEDLHLSHTEVDDMIRKLANVLLTRTLGGCLSGLIKQHLTLLQLIQISINMNYLERSCVYLEQFISNITGADKDSVHVSRLHGTAMFKDARSEAEEQIYKQINDKIDEFFDLAEYDWMMIEGSSSASEYIIDLVAFLHSTFQSFTNLPDQVAQTACMSACKHIAGMMLQLITDNEIKSLSQGALQQFNTDLRQCEEFALRGPVQGMNSGTLKLAFVDLRQLMDLFLLWDWTNFFADYGKTQSRYLRVNPATCIILLEKMRELDKKKNNMFNISFKKNERDKKKLLETVLKQLRQIVNGQSLQT